MKKESFTRHPVILGTAILTAAGLTTRLIGFFYRVFLSRLIGSEGMGIYQLVTPLMGVCISLSGSPLKTAVSRYIAESRDKKYFTCGLILSETVSVLLSIFFFFRGDWIALRVLQEPRTEFLIRIMALTLPIASAHSIITGYYFGIKNTGVPAFSQLTEQLVRVVTVLFLSFARPIRNLKDGIALAAIGLLSGESAAFLASLAAILLTFCRKMEPFSQNRISTPVLTLKKASASLISMSLPLCATRFTINLLQSAEAVKIPEALISWGMTSREALKLYGVLSGMAMPFIQFPSTLTGAASILLLPSVAENHARNNPSGIRKTSEVSIIFSICLGVFCTGLFFSLGEGMGELFFPDTEAGRTITLLSWVCPFLYLSAITGSIINGLGMTGTNFLHNLAGMLLRLSFILFLVPFWGIKAHLLGILLSEILITVLHMITLYRETGYEIDLSRWVFRPILTMVLMSLTVRLLPGGYQAFALILKSLYLLCGYAAVLLLTS